MIAFAAVTSLAPLPKTPQTKPASSQQAIKPTRSEQDTTIHSELKLSLARWREGVRMLLRGDGGMEGIPPTPPAPMKKLLENFRSPHARRKDGIDNSCSEQFFN